VLEPEETKTDTQVQVTKGRKKLKIIKTENLLQKLLLSI